MIRVFGSSARPKVGDRPADTVKVRAALRNDSGHGFLMASEDDFLAADHAVEQFAEACLRLECSYGCHNF